MSATKQPVFYDRLRGIFERYTGLYGPDKFKEVSTSAGGESVIQSATVPLTDAQIKTLGSAIGIEIVPAPGSGKIFNFIKGVVSLKTFAIYSNVDAGANFTFAQSADGENDYSQAFANAHGTFTATEDQLVVSPTKNVSRYYNTSVFENKGIYLWLYNNDLGDFEGGDPANTLIVTVYYTVIDL